jgi:effector-binding domain-containing protein
VQVEQGGNASTPGGAVATTVHIGPYNQMKSAHVAIHEWVRENGRHIAGPSWEVYGDWSDDPAKLRTDIYYLLR